MRYERLLVEEDWLLATETKKVEHNKIQETEKVDRLQKARKEYDRKKALCARDKNLRQS